MKDREGEPQVSGVKLGLCCSRPEGFVKGPARSSLENAVQFFQIVHADSLGEGDLADAEALSLGQLDSSAANLEWSLMEALENEVTHVLFLSSRTVFPFYSIQRMVAMEADAVSGISWTWLPGQGGDRPEVFPRLGYFDPEGRPYPYFGWSAPALFEVDWCGLDCLLLSRAALEEIAHPLERIGGREPALRISHCLRSRGVPILVDSSVQCPRMVSIPPGPRESGAVKSCLFPRYLPSPAARAEGCPEVRLVPSPATWREFQRDNLDRQVPLGRAYDPAYRGRSWYRQWVAAVAGAGPR
jgi:hypothetical protein